VSRGKLVRVEAALSMIDGAIKEVGFMLRQLPDLGKSPEEKARLGAFLSAVLNAMKETFKPRSLGNCKGFFELF
jgi:hypothetical protein